MSSSLSTTMLPAAEWDLFVLTMADAKDEAERGSLPVACHRVLAGLARAEQVAAAGEPWGPALLTLWRKAYDRLVHRSESRSG